MIFLVISLLDDKPPASNDNPERGPYPTPIQMSKHKPNHRMTTIHPLTPEPESTSSPSLSLKFKPILFGSTIGMSTDRKLLLISPVRHPSPPLIYSTSIPICLPDPLPLVTVVFTSLNETSEAVIGSSVSSPSHLEP